MDINGRHPLQLEMDDVTLEGANTSFQVHYRVAPRQFADTFNAIQAVTPLAVAIAGNSPTLFGHCLWQETRIPLFKQSIHTRVPDRYSWHEPARVSFGQGWVRREASELFVAAVRLYGLRPTINTWLPALPFNFAEHNFYRAAQYGLDARLVWPRERQCTCEEQTAATIIAAMLPGARDLQAMLEAYMACSADNDPVADWPL